MCSVNPGIRPNAVGPSRIPPARTVSRSEGGSAREAAAFHTQDFCDNFRLSDLCEAQGKELGC